MGVYARVFNVHLHLSPGAMETNSIPFTQPRSHWNGSKLSGPGLGIHICIHILSRMLRMVRKLQLNIVYSMYTNNSTIAVTSITFGHTVHIHLIRTDWQLGRSVAKVVLHLGAMETRPRSSLALGEVFCCFAPGRNPRLDHSCVIHDYLIAPGCKTCQSADSSDDMGDAMDRRDARDRRSPKCVGAWRSQTYEYRSCCAL